MGFNRGVETGAARAAKRGAPRSAWRAALTVFAGVLAVCLLERFVGERHPAAALLAYAPQVVFAVPPLAVLLVAAARRDGRAALASGAAVLSCATLLMGFRVPIPGREAASYEESLRLMTLNVEKWSHGADAVARAVRDLDPDVVCLQEAGRYHWLTGPAQDPDALAAALPEYRFHREGEVMVGSRLPVRAVRVHPLPPGPADRPAVEMVVEWQRGRPVRVVSVHVLPAFFDRILAEASGGNALAYVRRMVAERAAQTDALLRALESSGPELPILVCGDFNAQPQSLVHRRLTTTGYQSAFETAGWGFGYTLTAATPAMRVDHVFTGGGVRARRCWVPGVRASDHRPVIADVAIPEERLP